MNTTIQKNPHYLTLVQKEKKHAYVVTEQPKVSQRLPTGDSIEILSSEIIADEISIQNDQVHCFYNCKKWLCYFDSANQEDSHSVEVYAPTTLKQTR